MKTESDVPSNISHLACENTLTRNLAWCQPSSFNVTFTIIAIINSIQSHVHYHHHNYSSQVISTYFLNMSMLSKLLGRLVAKQLIDCLQSAKLFSLYHSAYRMNHSMETLFSTFYPRSWQQLIEVTSQHSFCSIYWLRSIRSIMKLCSDVWIFHTVSPDVH